MRKKLVLEPANCCPFDKSPCKRYDYLLRAGDCMTYDVNGRLRFVCKRFVAPSGFVVPKQLSEQQKKDSLDEYDDR